jgi:hypothetical protein
MTETLTIGQAAGRKVSKPDGSYFFLERYDPFSRTWYGSGYDAPNHDSVHSMVTSDRLLEFGIEIKPSAEELQQIEALRLTNKVKRAATELSSAITEWLNNPAAR